MIKEPPCFVSGGFSLQVITLLSLVAIDLMEIKIWRSSFVMRTHVTTWSEEYVALWLDMWHLIISHPSVKFIATGQVKVNLKHF